MMKTFMQEAATCGADDDEDYENLVRENEISSAVLKRCRSRKPNRRSPTRENEIVAVPFAKTESSCMAAFGR